MDEIMPYVLAPGNDYSALLELCRNKISEVFYADVQECFTIPRSAEAQKPNLLLLLT